MYKAMKSRLCTKKNVYIIWHVELIIIDHVELIIILVIKIVNA